MTKLTKLPIMEVAENLLGVVFRDAGNYHIGCCPIHDDSNPSFVIYKDSEYYHCWSCDRNGGDVIDLYRKATGCSFTEAIEKVCSNTTCDLGDEKQLEYPGKIVGIDEAELYAKVVHKMYRKIPVDVANNFDRLAMDMVDKFKDYALGIKILNENIRNYESSVQPQGN